MKLNAELVGVALCTLLALVFAHNAAAGFGGLDDVLTLARVLFGGIVVVAVAAAIGVTAGRVALIRSGVHP
jgi:MFS-type transporter involved in bile tolerance (Atg22 family)